MYEEFVVQFIFFKEEWTACPLLRAGGLVHLLITASCSSARKRTKKINQEGKYSSERRSGLEKRWTSVGCAVFDQGCEGRAGNRGTVLKRSVLV